MWKIRLAVAGYLISILWFFFLELFFNENGITLIPFALLILFIPAPLMYMNEWINFLSKTGMFVCATLIFAFVIRDTEYYDMNSLPHPPESMWLYRSIVCLFFSSLMWWSNRVINKYKIYCGGDLMPLR